MEKNEAESIDRIQRAAHQTTSVDMQKIGDKLSWIIQSSLSENTFEIHLAARMIYRELGGMINYRYHLTSGQDASALVIEHDDLLDVDTDGLKTAGDLHDYLNEYFYISSSEGSYDEDRYYIFHFDTDRQVHFTLVDIPTLVNIYEGMCSK